MRRIENKIGLTYLLMIVATMIVNGLISMLAGGIFFTSNVLLTTLIESSFYLLYIWMGTTRYKQLALISVLGIAILTIIILLLKLNTQESSEKKDVETWVEVLQTISNVVFCTIAYEISDKQSKEFLEEKKKEDEQKIKAIAKSEFMEEFEGYKEEIEEEIRREILRKMNIQEDNSEDGEIYSVDLNKKD